MKICLAHIQKYQFYYRFQVKCLSPLSCHCDAPHAQPVLIVIHIAIIVIIQHTQQNSPSALNPSQGAACNGCTITHFGHNLTYTFNKLNVVCHSPVNVLETLKYILQQNSYKTHHKFKQSKQTYRLYVQEVAQS